MRFTGKKQLYRYNKSKQILEPDGEANLQEQVNAYREDTLDAILKRMLDADLDIKLPVTPEIDMENAVDEFSGDLFQLVSDYGEALDMIGEIERDPVKLIEKLGAKIKAMIPAEPVAQPLAQLVAQDVAQDVAQPVAHPETASEEAAK